MSARTQVLTATSRRLDTRAQPFALAVAEWTKAQASHLIALAGRGELGKVRKAQTRDQRIAALAALLERFGLSAAADAQGRAVDIVTRRSSARTPVLSDFSALKVAIGDKAAGIYDTTEAAVLAEIQRIIQETEAADTGVKPTQTGIARELRARVAAKEGFDGAFTFERASRIARTELAIADNTGIIEGYKATGVDGIEWLAYLAPIWPRRHDKMNGVTAALGAEFTLPSGVKMKHPGDPLAPVGEVVHCRCSTAPVFSSPGKPRS